MSTLKKIAKKDLGKLLDEWSRDFTVFAPSNASGIARMEAWQGGEAGFLDWYRNSVIPPKDIVLPLLEQLFSFSKNEDGYKLETPPPDEGKQLIFGIRPCDAKALGILDMTFGDAYQDNYYLDRRRNTLLVGLGCTNPYDSCFCTALGGSPSDTTAMDIMLTDTGGELLAEAVTPAGEELLKKTGSLKEAAEEDKVKAEKSRQAAAQKVIRNVETEGTPEKLRACFEDKDFWQKTSAKCISCGVCTLLCPTCYCFDISDEKTKDGGVRVRSLDSCSFSAYTKMPMENPRSEKWQRVRNRVCHKYEYYPMLFDTIACTGCGRCIRLCPVNWDITQTLNSLPG